MSRLTEDQENQLQEVMRTKQRLKEACHDCIKSIDCKICIEQFNCKKWKDYLGIDNWVKLYSERLRYARECEENFYRDND